MEVYDYRRMLKRCVERLGGMRYGDVAIGLLRHLSALGLSTGRLVKYATYLCVLLKAIDFNPREAGRDDVERVVAWINSQPYSPWTRHDYKLVLRKLIQYAKLGRCDGDTPIPPEVSWIKPTVSRS